MKEIKIEDIIVKVKDALIDACINVDETLLKYLKKAKDNESGLGKEILNQIIENDLLANSIHLPICQDTGIVVMFVELGNEVYIDGDLNYALNEGVRLAYKEGYLRKSTLNNPIDRINTLDNLPPIVHVKTCVGNSLKIKICPKGAGSENMSRLKMLSPSEGVQGVKDFVLETVSLAGGRACPPLIVGVGIGGTLEKCACIAKEALLRPIDDESEIESARKLEKELLEEINALNIGPMGLKGKTTALSVKVNLFPCHIASLPVCVNLQCHVSRHKEIIL